MPIEAKWDHSYINDCIPNFSTNMEIPRHRWYEFKEGFGYTLVERAINETKFDLHKKELTVIDPFSGSGTTPLTALQNGCNAIALEVNPFMNFVGKTKCRKKNVTKEKLIDELNWILQQSPFEIESPLEHQSSFSPYGGKDKWLFNRSVLRGYEALYQIISKTENEDIFLLSLLASTMQCCNAKKDGKCLRYKKNWDTLGLSSRELRGLFTYNSLNMIDDIEVSPIINGERIFYEGDSRTSILQVEDEICDLVVFSPPYLNSFDYSDIYRPELFLGKYVSNNSELRDLRKKTLRSHVQCKWEKNDKSCSEWAKRIAFDIYQNRDMLWNKGIPDMINNYFYDMEQILYQMYRVSKKGAQLWFVVGTSSYVGVEIPVDLILADIAIKQGWTLVNVNALRRLRTSSQCASDKSKKIKLRESLVICKKE